MLTGSPKYLTANWAVSDGFRTNARSVLVLYGSGEPLLQGEGGHQRREY